MEIRIPDLENRSSEKYLTQIELKKEQITLKILGTMSNDQISTILLSLKVRGKRRQKPTQKIENVLYYRKILNI